MEPFESEIGQAESDTYYDSGVSVSVQKASPYLPKKTGRICSHFNQVDRIRGSRMPENSGAYS